VKRSRARSIRMMRDTPARATSRRTATRPSRTGATSRIVNGPGTLAQSLADTLLPSFTYQLSAHVGQRDDVGTANSLHDPAARGRGRSRCGQRRDARPDSWTDATL
jgi:hypothetical protein